jgi:hypothetical protein
MNMLPIYAVPISLYFNAKQTTERIQRTGAQRLPHKVAAETETGMRFQDQVCGGAWLLKCGGSWELSKKEERETRSSLRRLRATR